MNNTTPQAKGPFAYENWRSAEEAGSEWNDAAEYPLFSDAPRIEGELVDGYGPYQLLNTVHEENLRQSRPTLVLRIEYRLGDEWPQMNKTDAERYHGGDLQDEIAALVSLCLGVRLKAGNKTRWFMPNGDPRGRPLAIELSPDPILPPVSRSPILPMLRRLKSLKEDSTLVTFPRLSPEDANVLVHAARLYQEAVWIAEAAPELTWLLLVAAAETVAHKWRAAEESTLDRLRDWGPWSDLEGILKTKGDDEYVLQVAKMLVKHVGSTSTFTNFVLEFLPEQPAARPYELAQYAWGDPEAMKIIIKRIYNNRSQALHGGRPFPAPMCFPPKYLGGDAMAEKPPGGAISTKGGTWVAKDTPMTLHTFEYIVRHALLKWWRSMVPDSVAKVD